MTTGQPKSALAIFTNRNFTLLWLAQLVSSMGTSLTSLAAAIYVYRLTGSALNVGLMLMASAAPSVFVGLAAGVLVDRMDRKRIMLVADGVRAVLILLIPFLLPQSILWLYVLMLLTSAVGQFFEPAHASVLPELATEEELVAANSVIAVSQHGAYVVGFALAGIITGNYPIEWVFYLDAATFLFSGLCILAVNVPKLTVEGRTTVAAVLRNLRGGIAAIVETPILRSLLMVYAPTFALLGMINTLNLPFAVQALGADETAYGWLEAVAIVGFVAGSFWMAAHGGRLREGQWLTVSFLGMGLVGVIYGTLSSVGLALVVAALSGLFNAPSVVARSLIIQRNTPGEARGRAFSAFFVTRDLVFLVGMALAGLADHLSVRSLYLMASALTMLAGVWALVLPGLGQTAAEWLRALDLLRAAPETPGLTPGRPVTIGDFDRLITHQPALGRMDARTRKRLIRNMKVREATAGATILHKGDASSAAYFILSGRAVAGVEHGDDYRILEVMNPGDFFGEIAALTGVARTANVVAEENSTLIEVPATTLREMSADAQLNRLVMSQMATRMMRTHALDMPRFGGVDQGTLRDLRTPPPDDQ